MSSYASRWQRAGQRKGAGACERTGQLSWAHHPTPCGRLLCDLVLVSSDPCVLLWLVCGHGTARLRYADIHQPDSSIAAPAQPTVAGSCSVRSIPRVQGPLAHYGVLCRL